MDRIHNIKGQVDDVQQFLKAVEVAENRFQNLDPGVDDHTFRAVALEVTAAQERLAGFFYQRRIENAVK